MPIFRFALQGFCVDVEGAAHLLKHIKAPSRQWLDLWMEIGGAKHLLDPKLEIHEVTEEQLGPDPDSQIELLIEDFREMPEDDIDWTWFARVPAGENPLAGHTGLYFTTPNDDLHQDVVLKWRDDIKRAAKWYADNWFEKSPYEGKTDAEIKQMEDEGLAELARTPSRERLLDAIYVVLHQNNAIDSDRVTHAVQELVELAIPAPPLTTYQKLLRVAEDSGHLSDELKDKIEDLAQDLDNIPVMGEPGDEEPDPDMPPEVCHNFYRCDDCNIEWEDEDCDAEHNDRCPGCRAEIEPYKSLWDGQEDPDAEEPEEVVLDRSKGRTDTALWTCLLLVIHENHPKVEQIESLDDDTYWETYRWAMAEHLSASDNPVKRYPKPDWLKDYQ